MKSDKKIDKKKLLLGLDKITTKVAKKIKKSKNKDFVLMKRSDEKVQIADFFVIKDDNGDFSVLQKDKVLFKQIASFEFASSIINSILTKNPGNRNTLLDLNKEFVKLSNEMVFYEHSLKSKSKEDKPIVISRIELTRLKIEDVLDRLYRFKVTI